MMRILICFIVAVVMLLSAFAPLQAAAPPKHCWWHHHHHCHTWGPREWKLPTGAGIFLGTPLPSGQQSSV